MSKDVIALAHTLTTTLQKPFIFHMAGEFLEHATSWPLSQKEKPLVELPPHSAGSLLRDAACGCEFDVNVSQWSHSVWRPRYAACCELGSGMLG